MVLAYLAFAVVAAGVLDALFGYTPEQEELSETLDLELTPLAVVALYLSACLMAPLTEETFFAASSSPGFGRATGSGRARSSPA